MRGRWGGALEVFQHVVDGIAAGSILAIAALGLTLSFGIARFANAAHGDFMTVSAYVALWSSTGLGLGMLPSVVVACIVTVAAFFLTDFLVYRPLGRSSALALLISSIGVALFLRSAVSLAWGTRVQGYELTLRRAYEVLGLSVTPTDAVIIAVTLVLAVLVYVLLNRTRIGKELRAFADLPELCRVVGLDSRRIVRWMWAISAVSAAVAGVLVGVRTSLTPNLGWNLLLPAFAATVLGGIGNPLGAIAGGYVIGIAEEVATMFVEAKYKDVIAFLILAIVLIWRPSGILGDRDAV